MLCSSSLYTRAAEGEGRGGDGYSAGCAHSGGLFCIKPWAALWPFECCAGPVGGNVAGMKLAESIVCLCPGRAAKHLGQGPLLSNGLCINRSLYSLSPCLVTLLWDNTLSLWTSAKFCLVFASTTSLLSLIF